MRYSICTPSGSVASCVEPSREFGCAGAVVAALSVVDDAAGALGAVFLLQADNARITRMSNRPWDIPEHLLLASRR
jgi:hypothetical protein